jgi:hypothetical protein
MGARWLNIERRLTPPGRPCHNRRPGEAGVAVWQPSDRQGLTEDLLCRGRM